MFVLWPNTGKRFVENVRTERVLSKAITHPLTGHCISAKTVVIRKTNTCNGFFSTFETRSYTYSHYMNIPFKAGRTVWASKGAGEVSRVAEFSAGLSHPSAGTSQSTMRRSKLAVQLFISRPKQYISHVAEIHRLGWSGLWMCKKPQFN